MTPRTRGSQRRKSAPIRHACPSASPSSNPTTEPRNNEVCLAIIPYQGPPSSQEAHPPMSSSSVKTANVKRSMSEGACAKKDKVAAKGKTANVKERVFNKGDSPHLGSTLVTKRNTRTSSKPPSSGPCSQSPDSASPPHKRQKATTSMQQVFTPKLLSINNLLELVRVPRIVQERSFVVDELGGLFREAVHVQEWEEVIARMASVRLNLTLVREFYANLADAFGPSQKAETVDSRPVAIRGKKIMFGPSNIRYALSLPSATKVDKERVDNELKLLTKEQVIERCYMHQPSKIPGELSCGQLHTSHRALGHLVRALLYPTTQTSQLPIIEAKLLCYLATERKKVPAEFFLFESVRRLAISIARNSTGVKSSLFHPAVITIVCHQQGIVTRAGDELVTPVKLSMSSVIRGNAQSRAHGPSIEVEAALSIARRNAASCEDRTNQRLSAIDGSVSDLRKEVVCLQGIMSKVYDALVTAKVVQPNDETDELEDDPATKE